MDREHRMEGPSLIFRHPIISLSLAKSRNKELGEHEGRPGSTRKGRASTADIFRSCRNR